MVASETLLLARAVMEHAYQLILVGGGLGVVSILAGIASRRIGAPMLLAFLALGMLAGKNGLLHIPFNDFRAAYLIGSVALAVILFEGGLKTPISTMRRALWPALVLATIGVAVTALVVALVVAPLESRSFSAALLVAATVAPTDAAAVAVLLRGGPYCRSALRRCSKSNPASMTRCRSFLRFYSFTSSSLRDRSASPRRRYCFSAK